jgi:hypothetical protein
MVVTALDGTGNLAHPVWLQIGADGSQAAVLETPPIRSSELVLSLANDGLTEIRIEIAGRAFTLRADPSRTGFDGDTAYVKAQGPATLNIRRFVGEGGPVKITAVGPPNASAVLEIHP